MIISHKYKFIFFHIPKTGGSSIKNALRSKECLPGVKDRSLTPKEAKLTGIPEKYIGTWQHHLPVREARKLVPDHIWNCYFKFSFVRNPWDLMVSLYHYKIQSLAYRKRKPDDYLKVKECRDFSGWLLASYEIPRTMNAFLSDDRGRILVDFIGRKETLQKDFDKICEIMGLETTVLSQENKTDHRHYSYYYDDQTRRRVAEWYDMDIKHFGYEFEEKSG